MAINMLNENEYLQCPKCKGVIFKEKNTFTLRKKNTPSGVKLTKDNEKIIYVCSSCETDMTNQVVKYSMI